ncbi:MAG: protein-L-isoaspartate O-methyltransferase [Legionellales bacterium]|nr:protein-L-isoaspartate O-methyltransferase [Legionellales bacterium]
MDIEHARDNMIKNQINTWNVFDEKILDLFYQTPRELFVPVSQRHLAFTDTQIDLGHGQAMFTPKEEARMLQELAIKQSDHILEIGTGSGFCTALFARLAMKVVSVDIFKEFTQDAQHKLHQLHLNNVELITADASHGLNYPASFDVIAITGSLLKLPPRFQESLKIGGRIFCILGDGVAMNATLLTRISKQEWQRESLYETVTPRLLNALEPQRFVF